jgi:hypothetical protein
MHNPVRMKNFHGLWAGNVHECSPKFSIGRVTILLLTLCSCALSEKLTFFLYLETKCPGL